MNECRDDWKEKHFCKEECVKDIFHTLWSGCHWCRQTDLIDQFIPLTLLLIELSICVSAGMIDHYLKPNYLHCHDRGLNIGLFLQAQKYIQSLPFMPQQDLEKIFRGANPLGRWCPADWITYFWNSIERLREAAKAQVALSILQFTNPVTQLWPFGDLLPALLHLLCVCLC